MSGVDEVNSFEGPLEFYYPGQQDMTLVAGSVSVMGIQSDWDSETDPDEDSTTLKQETSRLSPHPGSSFRAPASTYNLCILMLIYANCII